MKFLVYAILKAADIHAASLTRGIDEHPVSVRIEDDLGMVLSTVKEEAGPPDRSRLLAFARVLGELGRDRTILPVRYGTLLANENQANALLRCKHDALVAALSEVDDCVEMTLWVLKLAPMEPETQLRGEQPHFGSCSHGSLVCASGSMSATERNPSKGAAYILSRRMHYVAQDNTRKRAEDRLGRFRTAFAGLFVRSRSEESRAGAYPALHFLVRRENLERFYEAFHHIERLEGDPLLLTGPWVPYNFVNLPSDGLMP